PPSRRVNQPGTTTTLDPGQGQIPWQPYQVGNYVWFTHGIDDSGFPTIRYGSIRLSDNRASVAVAYHSPTSDDFNPSIGVPDAGNANTYTSLNWPYPAPPNNAPPPVTVDAVPPGAGIPTLIGTGVVLVTGASTSTNPRFGDYSPVPIDPPSGPTGCIAAI